MIKRHWEETMSLEKSLTGYRQFKERFEDEQDWLCNLHTGDLLACDDESGEWGTLAWPKGGS
jgi:hypothetical protein